MSMTAIASFRTTQDLKKRVAFLAKETRRTSSFYFNILLENYLEDLEDIYLSEKVLQDIRNGKEKTYTAEEVFSEAGL
jgi:RHH-type rel operon transcriptional repressor/antitoxin RelB